MISKKKTPFAFLFDIVKKGLAKENPRKQNIH